MERNTHGRTHCSPYRSHGSVLLRFGGGGTLQPAAMEGGGGHTAAPTAAMGGGGGTDSPYCSHAAPTAAMDMFFWGGGGTHCSPYCSHGYVLLERGGRGGHTAAPTAAMDMFCWRGGHTAAPTTAMEEGGMATLHPLLQPWRGGEQTHCSPYCSHGYVLLGGGGHLFDNKKHSNR